MNALPWLRDLLLRYSARISGSAVAVVFVLIAVVLFIVPVPAPVLDLLITLNLAVSLLLLISALLTPDSRKLQGFPAILLLTTLFRLSLNVSSTRLILLYGDRTMHAAGRVIESFGLFVVQGDFVVGGIVFAIIAIVNFLVVTKGSARVAEVSARFTLDSLPGKQLAIDSELRSGNITRDEARQQRRLLERESDFYGSMDGAMRFVQGDAIAGFIIVFVNSVGGVALGLHRGITFSEAINSFGVLAVGDGLVNLVPSLMISVCAGIVVTHSSGRSLAANDRKAILAAFLNSSAARAAAIAILGLGLLTGFPLLPALVICVPLLLLAELGRADTAFQEANPVPGPSRIIHISPVGQRNRDLGSSTDLRPLELRIGREIDERLRQVLDSDQKWLELTADRLSRRVQRLTGLHTSVLTIECDPRLDGKEYQIFVRERLVASAPLPVHAWFVKLPPRSARAFALPVVGSVSDPLDSVLGSWITPHLPFLPFLDKLGALNHSALEHLLLEALSAPIREPEMFFGVEEAQELLNEVRLTSPTLADAVFAADVLTAAELADLLRRLLRERVSIRDLKLILEGVMEFSSISKKTEDRQNWMSGLHGFVRRTLGRQIVQNALQPDGELRAFVVSNEIEEEFLGALRSWDGDRSRPAINPEVERQLYDRIDQISLPIIEHGACPIVILCPAEVRAALQEFLRVRDAGRGLFKAIAFEELHGQTITPTFIGILGA